jgi:hypothetical protein
MGIANKGDNMSKHTPGPWKLGEYDEYLGYDCMSGGIKAGPVYLDAADYGQEDSKIAPETMLADAFLIAAAPELLEGLKAIEAMLTEPLAGKIGITGSINTARALIAKAEGRDAT